MKLIYALIGWPGTTREWQTEPESRCQESKTEDGKVPARTANEGRHSGVSVSTHLRRQRCPIFWPLNIHTYQKDPDRTASEATQTGVGPQELTSDPRGRVSDTPEERVDLCTVLTGLYSAGERK